MAGLKSQGNIVPTTKLGPVGASIPRALSPTINPLAGAAAAAEENLAATRQLEAADAAAKHEFQIDPTTNLPVLPEQKSSFSIFGKQFNKEIRRNYLLRLDTDVETELGEIANRNYLNPAAFSAEASAYLDTVTKSVDPIAKTYIAAKGGDRLGALLSGIRSRFAQKEISEAKHKRKIIAHDIASQLGEMPVGLDVNQRAKELVDHWVSTEQGADQLFSSPAARSALVREVTFAHAVNNYWLKFRELPKGLQLDALDSFAKTGEYKNAEGIPILKKFKGMTGQETRTVTALLSSVYNDTAAIQLARNKIAVREQTGALLQMYIKSEGLDPENPIVSNVLALEDPKVAMGLLTHYSKIVNDKAEDTLKREWAAAMLPVVNSALERAGMSSFKLSEESLNKMTDGNRMMDNINYSLRLAGLGEADRRAYQNAENLRMTESYGQRLIEITQAELEAKGIDYDIASELEARLHGVDGGNAETFSRLRLRAISKLMSEASEKLREKNLEDGQAIDQEDYVNNVLVIKGLGENAEEVLGLLRQLKDDDVSPSIAWQLLNQKISMLDAQKKSRETEVKKMHDLVFNMVTFQQGGKVVPLHSTPDLRNRSGILFETSAPFVQRAEGVSEKDAYIGDLGYNHFLQTGIVPKKLISYVTSMTSDRDNAATAVAVFNRYSSIPGWQGERLRSRLDAGTVRRLDFLLRAGATPENINLTFQPGFDGSLDKNTPTIWGDLKPQALADKQDEVFAEAVTDMKTHSTDRGWIESIVTFMPWNFAADDWHEASETRGGPARLINTETFPKRLKDDAIAYMQHNLGPTITIPGDKTQLKGAIQTALKAVLKRGEYGTSRYSSSTSLPGAAWGNITGPGKKNLGKWHVVYKPIEMYAVDEDKKISWVNGFIEKTVNHRMHRLPGAENEWWGADDIRLMPLPDKLNKDGVPLYRVQIAGSKGLVQAFEQIDITEITDVDGDIQVSIVDTQIRNIDIDIGPALKNQNSLIRQQKEFEAKNLLINRRKDYAQRASVTQPKREGHAPTAQSLKAVTPQPAFAPPVARGAFAGAIDDVRAGFAAFVGEGQARVNRFNASRAMNYNRFGRVNRSDLSAPTR